MEVVDLPRIRLFCLLALAAAALAAPSLAQAGATPTPTGQWYVVDRLRLRTSWAYGKWALATSAFSRILKHFEGGQGEVAMHARGSLTAPVGTAASHGCVRFRDGDIAWMAAHVPN